MYNVKIYCLLLFSVMFLFLFPVFLYSQNPNDVVVNEVMYAPTASSSEEWFEIYNKSGNVINLNNWKWKDNTTTIRTITLQNISLNPNGFAIVCQDSNAVKNFYPNFSGIVLQPTNGWSTLNNTGDQIILFNSSVIVIDSLNFSSSWGGSTGNKSLERILTSGNTNQQSNWGTCLSIAGATPDKQNSLTPKQNDLALNALSFDPINPVLLDSVTITANVKNRGLNSASNFTVNFYRDDNLDSIPSVNELFASINSVSTLNSNDSINLSKKIQAATSGLIQIIAVVTYSSDEDTTNNKKISSFNVGSGSSSGNIIINEFMYDPPSNESEWVELLNTSDTIVNLKNWKIQDSTTTSTFITSNDYFLYPDSFVVLSKSSSIFTNHPNLNASKVLISSSYPSLNNTGDAIIIYKINGTVSDRVDYLSEWGGSGVSLERVNINGISGDPKNWAPSIDCEKSTPGRNNSITLAQHYNYLDLVVNEIMSSPFTNEAEWIELYNPTNKTIDISNWKMYESSTGLVISDTCSSIIKPGSYVVFAADTTVLNRYSYLKTPDSTFKVFIHNKTSLSSLGLNNDADLVQIKDLFNTNIDSVYYSDKWNNPNITSTTGVSLEKINYSLPSNDKSSWSSCTLPVGGTPGKKNSIFTQVLPSSGSVTISPNPFSPDADGFEDFTIINYSLSSSFSQVRLKIFDIKGRLVRTILNNRTLGQSGSIVFDGLDDSGQKLRIGIYIIFLESLNDMNGVVDQIKTTFVVAAKL
jgi:hypothetical protein